MDERSREIERRLELPLLVFALLTIPAIALEYGDAEQPWHAVGIALNWIIWLAFVAEVVIMLRVVPDRGGWLRNHPLDLAIVIFTPPFLPASLQAARGQPPATHRRTASWFSFTISLCAMTHLDSELITRRRILGPPMTSPARAQISSPPTAPMSSVRGAAGRSWCAFNLVAYLEGTGELRFDFTHLWTLRDGVPERCRLYFDHAEALAAAGLRD